MISVDESATAASSDVVASRGPGRRSRRAVGAVVAAALILIGLLAVSARPRQDNAQPPAPDEVAALTAIAPVAPPAVISDVSEDEIGTALSIEWTSGLAERLPCNQLQGSTFSNGAVPADFFDDPAVQDTVVASGGFADSSALQVGEANATGHYAEAVAISPGQTYMFRAWVNPSGPVEQAEIGIAFIDANRAWLDPALGHDVRVPVDPTSPGFVEVGVLAPPDAVYALPYVSKHSSGGVLLADELVFGVADDCRAEITASGQ